MDIYNLVSFGGVFILLMLGWVFSGDRGRMNFRCIGWGVGVQLLLGLIVFRAPFSREVFLWLNEAVLKLLTAAQAGQKFLFGPLALGEGETGAAGEESLGFILAFQGLPMIIFFAALMGLLYYWRIMPLVIRGFSWFFTRAMRISGAESLCAASNIFVGIESVTAVRPYLGRMTRSEFCTILTAGMATVASSVLGVYVWSLKDVFPTIAGHLISASILSAPAAVVMSKILVPEDGAPVTLGRQVEMHQEPESGAIEAVINGAMAGVKLVVGICALLIAFLGLLAVVDLFIGGLGHLLGSLFDAQWEWSLQKALGYLMAPLAMIMGIEPKDITIVGGLLGERLVATEVPAYLRLAELMDSYALSPRSCVVSAYGLCGFAHVASLAIFVGGVTALAPQRREDITKVALRALGAATLACLMTGAVAGTFYHEGAVVFQTAGG
ncbi:MAG: nucleoside transporter [Phycisphaerae bacterium SM23_30]|nr:MAG: nucleoside transporter [Phycisphaerae bacterium SM23_30]